MKKLFALLAAALLVGGCGREAANGPAAGETDRLTVIATIFPPYDFAREIAGDRAQVTQLLPPGAESHSFEPSPQDVIAIQNCGLFIYAGGESDVWIEGILESMGDKAPQTLRLIDCVEPLGAEITEGMQAGGEEHHRHDGHSRQQYDEHVWTSPQNAVKIAQAIAESLSAADSQNADFYERRLAGYTERLEKLDASLRETVESASRDLIVVGDRFPFLYLAKHYGLKYYAAFPACGSEGDASAATVAFLADTVKERRIPAVLHIEFSNRKVAGAIAESAGVETMLLHSCHNVTAQEQQSGASYITLMEQNIQTLKTVLNAP